MRRVPSSAARKHDMKSLMSPHGVTPKLDQHTDSTNGSCLDSHHKLAANKELTYVGR